MSNASIALPSFASALTRPGAYSKCKASYRLYNSDGTRAGQTTLDTVCLSRAELLAHLRKLGQSTVLIKLAEIRDGNVGIVLSPEMSGVSLAAVIENSGIVVESD